MSSLRNRWYFDTMSVLCSIIIMSAYIAMPSYGQDSPATLKDVSVNSDGSVTISLTEPVEYIYTFIDNPPRLFVNFKNKVAASLPPSQAVNSATVVKIRAYYTTEQTIDALVFELTAPLKYSVSAKGGTVKISFAAQKPAPEKKKAEVKEAPAKATKAAAKKSDISFWPFGKKKEKAPAKKAIKKQPKPAAQTDQQKLINKLKKEKAQKEKHLKKQNEKAARKHTKTGDKAFKKKDYGTAIAEWEKASQLTPDDTSLTGKIQDAKKKLQEQYAQESAGIRKKEITSKTPDTSKIEKKAKTPKKDKKRFSIWPFGSSSKKDAVKPSDKPSMTKEEKEAKKLTEKIKRQEEKKQAQARKNNEKAAKAILKDGDKAYKKKDYTTAIDKWNKALTLKPGDAAIKSKIDTATKQRAAAKDTVAAAAPDVKAPETAKKRKSWSLWPFKRDKDTGNKKEDTKKAPEKKLKKELIKKPAQTATQRSYTNLTLKDCVDIGMRNRFEIKIAQEEMVLAQLKLADAKRQLYPRVLINEEEMRGKTTDDIEGRHIGLELEQPLYQGKKLVNSYKQAEVNLAVAMRKYEKTRNEYTLQVEEAYYNLINFQKKHELKQELLKKAEEIKESAEKQKKIGAMRELDVLDIKAQLEDINYETTAVEKDLALSKLTLIQTLELNDQEISLQPIDLGKTMEITLEQCKKLALENNPSLRVNSLLASFHEYAIKIARSQDAFKVDLSGSYGYGAEDFTDNDLNLEEEYFAGIKLSKTFGPHTLEDNIVTQDKVPQVGQTTSSSFVNNKASLSLFTNNSKISTKEAQLAYFRAKDEFQKTLNSTVFEVTEKYYDYEKAVLQITSTHNKIQYQESELAAVREQSKLNQVSVAEILKTQNKMCNIKTEYTNAYSSYFIAVARLNKAMGKPGYFDPVSGTVNARGYFGDSVGQELEKEVDQALTALKKAETDQDINYGSLITRKNWDEPVYINRCVKDGALKPTKTNAAASKDAADKKRFWQFWK